MGTNQETHPPRLFAIRRDGSGIEFHREADVELFIEAARADPDRTTIISEPVLGDENFLVAHTFLTKPMFRPPQWSDKLVPRAVAPPIPLSGAPVGLSRRRFLQVRQLIEHPLVGNPAEWTSCCRGIQRFAFARAELSLFVVAMFTLVTRIECRWRQWSEQRKLHPAQLQTIDPRSEDEREVAAQINEESFQALRSELENAQQRAVEQVVEQDAPVSASMVFQCVMLHLSSFANRLQFFIVDSKRNQRRHLQL